MSAKTALRQQLQPGKVYRRGYLKRWSRDIDRQLGHLVRDGALMKLAGGIYYSPTSTEDGIAPAERAAIVSAFLKDDRFLFVSPDAYSLLINIIPTLPHTIVYNRKRHGVFELGGTTLEFRMRSSFPVAVTPEFTLIDIVNNLPRLRVNRDDIQALIRAKARTFEPGTMKRLVDDYGGKRTRKFFYNILPKQSELIIRPAFFSSERAER